MSGKEESGSETGQPEAQETASRLVAPSGRDVDDRRAPREDTMPTDRVQQPASSPPVGGGERHDVEGSPPVAAHQQAPPMRRNDDQQVTTATATAVTPDTRQLAPPEMISPPYSSIRQKKISPGGGPSVLSVSPTKRSAQAASGEFCLVVFYDIQTGGNLSSCHSGNLYGIIFVKSDGL